MQVGGGDQRVQLRVVERAGEVHVDVRTSDGNLAGAMRQELPALASRLEQTGFRAETWHGGAATEADRPQAADSSSGASQDNSQDAPRQDGRGQQDNPQQQQQQQQQRPWEDETVRGSKTNRKDFSWLFQSIR
jgi:hypothetical protein